MKNVLLILGLGLLLVACGDGTVGPLGGEGLVARDWLRDNVDLYRSYRSGDERSLDALITIQLMTYGTDSGGVEEISMIDAMMVDLNGRIEGPKVSLNGTPMVTGARRSATAFTKSEDTNLVFRMTWPDTVVDVAHAMYRWSTIGSLTHPMQPMVISRSSPTPLPTVGLRSDSVRIRATIPDSSGYLMFGFLYSMQPDNGTFRIPDDVMARSRPGDRLYVEVMRSYYRTIDVSSPKSGYGDRVIGILQVIQVLYPVNVVE